MKITNTMRSVVQAFIKYPIVGNAILLTIFLFGCEQNPYQITKGEDGLIYRLNRKTGEMAVIKDNEVVPLDTTASKVARKFQEISEEKTEKI